jgi:hypothetical protein
MTIIGNHMKFNVHKNLRDRVREFYLDLLQCTTMPSPAPVRLRAAKSFDWHRWMAVFNQSSLARASD